METPTPTKSESIDLLSAALARAQGRFPRLHKNRSVTVHPKDPTKRAYTFSYATLDLLIEITRGVLADEGLSISSRIEGSTLVTSLQHASGQWISCRIPLPDPLDPKTGWAGYGSAVTYARRYSQAALLNLAADDDDDAATANGDTRSDVKDAPDPFDDLLAVLETKGIVEPSDVRAWCERVLGRPVPSSDSMTPEDVQILLSIAKENKPEPPKASLAQIEALNKAIDAIAPWGSIDFAALTPYQIGEEKKRAKLAWCAKHLGRTIPGLRVLCEAEVRMLTEQAAKEKL